ncbi:MAG TPA: DUF4870 domain-containing protein [Actinomycetota bacterium]|nr:DUF4870 domain-containing protein [Actinomycetota bacterium]
MDRDERMLATMVHLLAFCGLLFPLGGNVLGPLILWLVKRDTSMFFDENGKESVNFQISMLIYVLVATLLIEVLIGIPLVAVLLGADAVLVVIAAVKANRGEFYRYPISIRFIK